MNTLCDVSDARVVGRETQTMPDGGMWVMRLWSDGWAVTEVYDHWGACLAVIKRRVGESG